MARKLHDTTRILTVAGVALLAAALIFNQFAVGAVAPHLPGVDLGGQGLATDAVFGKVRISQGILALMGFACLVWTAAIRRSPGLAVAVGRPWVGRLTLALFSFALPLLLLELLLRPFVWDPTPAADGGVPVFIRDTTLGWRLNPGVTGNWGGHQVVINERGMRGPTVPLERSDGTLRVLYLGDSVTFGYMVEPHHRTYPFLTQRLLAERLGVTVETVNGAVGGYSPWQEALWLRSDGLAYSPDLVIQGFVLNDVTEKFDLVRFGGPGEGVQLQNARTGPLERLFWSCGVLHTARRINARLRFGADTRAGALRHQRLNIVSLLSDSEQESVRAAWSLTLDRLDDIVGACAERGIPLAVIVFPNRLQVGTDPLLDAPQRTLLAHLEDLDVPALDLLPLATRIHAEVPGPFFIDDNHLTPAGHRLVADELSGFLVVEGLVQAPGSASLDPPLDHPPSPPAIVVQP